MQPTADRMATANTSRGSTLYAAAVFRFISDGDSLTVKALLAAVQDAV